VLIYDSMNKIKLKKIPDCIKCLMAEQIIFSVIFSLTVSQQVHFLSGSCLRVRGWKSDTHTHTHNSSNSSSL